MSNPTAGDLVAELRAAARLLPMELCTRAADEIEHLQRKLGATEESEELAQRNNNALRIEIAQLLGVDADTDSLALHDRICDAIGAPKTNEPPEVSKDHGIAQSVAPPRKAPP